MVVMRREECNNEVKGMLETSTYQAEGGSHSTPGEQTELQAQRITEGWRDYQESLQVTWQPPYGLPKIHKTKVPLRPIVS